MHNRNVTRAARAPRLLLGALLALLAALAIGACGGSGSDDSSGDGQQIDVALTDGGCTPKDVKATSGPATFKISNDGSGKLTEVEVLKGALILGERENIVSGLNGSFSLELQPGTYDISCNDGSNHDPTGKLVVTGSAPDRTTDPVLANAAKQYGHYVRQQAALLVQRTTQFAAAVKAGDVAKAKSLYETARVPYERIEPVAESFGDLDPAIDARINDVAEGQRWTGFHPIERALWQDNTTKGMSGQADELVANVKKLQRLVKTKTYDPVTLANGAVELLNEVSQSKITGEEERYSHVDLTTFRANVDGAEADFNLLEPGLTKRDPQLAKQVKAQFANVDKALAPYHVKGEVYVNYSKVTKAERRKLSQAVDALAHPLGLIGGKIVGQ